MAFTCSRPTIRRGLGLLSMIAVITLSYISYTALSSILLELNSDQSIVKNRTIKRTRQVVTLALTDLFLWNPSDDPLFPNFGWLDLKTLLMLVQSNKYELHLIACALSSEEQSDITRLLIESGCVRDRETPYLTQIYFYQSKEEREALIDRISPTVQVESCDFHASSSRSILKIGKARPLTQTSSFHHAEILTTDAIDESLSCQ